MWDLSLFWDAKAASIGSYQRFDIILKGQAVQEEMPVPANQCCTVAYREGGFGGFKPPPRNSGGRPKSCQT